MDMLPTLGCLQVSDQVQAAEWLAPRLHGDRLDVCALVPTGFEAYARIFHPAHELSGARLSGARPVRWSEIARRTGHQAHAGMQWELIRPAGREVEDPAMGTMNADCAERVAAVLAPYTATSVWFGMWVGRQPLLIPQHAPTFSLPLREMYLLHGPLAGLTQNLASPPLETLPTMAWPEDRSWVLATDADLRESYLAGSQRCVTAVVDNPDLEAAAVAPEHPVTVESDTLNPR